jgi:hypothetical protein
MYTGWVRAFRLGGGLRAYPGRLSYARSSALCCLHQPNQWGSALRLGLAARWVALLFWLDSKAKPAHLWSFLYDYYACLQCYLGVRRAFCEGYTYYCYTQEGQGQPPNVFTNAGHLVFSWGLSLALIWALAAGTPLARPLQLIGPNLYTAYARRPWPGLSNLATR